MVISASSLTTFILSRAQSNAPPSIPLLGLVLNGITSGRFQRGCLRLHWTYGQFNSIVHALQIACVSTDLYVIAQWKPKFSCTMPWNLLDFVSGRPKHLECPLTGRAFVGGKGMPLCINEKLYLVQVGLKPTRYFASFCQRSVKQHCIWYPWSIPISELHLYRLQQLAGPSQALWWTSSVVYKSYMYC